MTVTVGWRSRIRRLALARLISVAGGAAAYIGVTFSLYERTGSSVWVAAALLCTTGVQSVALPFAGALADRFDRAAVMICSDVIAGLVFLTLVLTPPVPVMLLLAAVSAVAEAPFLPASAAVVVELSGDGPLLDRANGMISAASSLGRTAGPTLAGVLIAGYGSGMVFAVNAISFLVSAALVWSLRAVRTTVVQRAVLRGQIRRSARYLLGNRRLRLYLVSSAGAYVTTSFAMVAEPTLATEFGVGSIGYGLMITGWGTGMVAGSLWAGRRAYRIGERRVLFRSRLVMGTGILLVAFAPVFWPVPVLMVVGGAGSGALLTAAFSQMQRNTTGRLRASVVSLVESAGTISFVSGVLAAGFLVDRIGVTTAYLIAGIGTLMTAIPLFFNARE